MHLYVDQKIICDVPMEIVDNIYNAIDEQDWLKNDYRNAWGNLTETNSIPIMHTQECIVCRDDFDAIESIGPTEFYDKYFSFIKPVLDLLKDHYDFKQYSAVLARLNPNSNVGMHPDSGYFLTKCHRIHLPIKTNDLVFYCIDNKKYNWKKGTLYEFDNTRNHGVENKSDEYRIHLIINLYNLSNLPSTI